MLILPQNVCNVGLVWFSWTKVFILYFLGVWSPGGSAYHPTPSFNTTKPTSSGSSLPSTSATQNGGSAPLRPAPQQQTQPQTTHQSQTSHNESTSQSTLSKTEINELQSLAKVTSSCIVSNGLIPNSVNSSGVSSSIKASSSKAPEPNNTISTSSPSSGDNPPPPPPPPLPVWTPRSQPPSPAQERKEFKPVTFDSPTLQRKQLQEQLKSEVSPQFIHTFYHIFGSPVEIGNCSAHGQ